MPYHRLADFLVALHDDGDMVRIAAEVDPKYELAAVTDRVGKSHSDGGPALLFENVKGSVLPAVSNLLGSERRLCKVLGVGTFDEAARRLVAAVTPEIPEGWSDSLRLLPRLSQLASVPPRVVKSGACQQVVKLGSDVNLTELPIPHCWPGETNRTLTAAHVYLRSLSTGARHVGRYPLQVAGRNGLVMYWDIHDEAAHIHQEYVAAERQMPVAVALGGDPVLTYAATAPLPPGADALLLTGLLQGAGVEVVRGRSVEIEVPAHAEFILEGYVAPADAAGGMGAVASRHGFVLEHRNLPTLQVTALTHRANPVLPVIVRGQPPSEEQRLNKLTERLLLPFVRYYLPEVVDINLPECGGVSRLLFVSIRKQYPRQAAKVMHALWSLRPLLTVKSIVTVDADVDVQDERQVWFAVASHLDAGRDVIVADGPRDLGDHSTPLPGVGGKLGLDATRKGPAEGTRHNSPVPTTVPSDVRQQIAARWQEFGLASGQAAVQS
jgi:4-hydroxy-3-polyprenylbenzoate decarboxylase